MFLLSLLPLRAISSMNPVLRPIVVCGPSGSGKSTLLRKLIDEFEDYLGFTVSHTTRKPRDGEVDGREYHFTSRESMMKAIDDGEFIEYAEFSGNLYGTSKRAMKDVQKAGKICVLDLEIEGVRNMKKQKDLNPMFILVKAPSLEVLEARLRNRGTDSDESISRRLKRAEEDLSIENIESFFDLILVNDDKDRAYKELRDFIEPVYHLKSLKGGSLPREVKIGYLKRVKKFAPRFYKTCQNLAEKIMHPFKLRKLKGLKSDV